MPHASPTSSLAQGFAVLATLLVAHVTLAEAAAALRPHVTRRRALESVCQTPLAVETAHGARLGCTDEPALASCQAQAFDHVRLVQGRCQRSPDGMPVAWFVSLGYRLNINRAKPEHLQALPHIGPSTARAIVRYRAAHGPFDSVEALGAVDGVGPGRVAQLRQYVTAADGG